MRIGSQPYHNCRGASPERAGAFCFQYRPSGCRETPNQRVSLWRLVQAHRTDPIVPTLIVVSLHLPGPQVRNALARNRREAAEVRVIVNRDVHAAVNLNRADRVVESLRNIQRGTASLTKVVPAVVRGSKKARAVARFVARSPAAGIPPGRTTPSVRHHAELRPATAVHPDPAIVVAPGLALDTSRVAYLAHHLHRLPRVADRTKIAFAVIRFACD